MFFKYSSILQLSALVAVIYASPSPITIYNKKDNDDAPCSKPGNITWSDMTEKVGVPAALGTLTVPLDYTNSCTHASNTLELFMLKVNAVKEKKGTIILNYGGPGISGIESLGVAPAILLA